MEIKFIYKWHTKVSRIMSKFVAIDFETANNSRASACSVGLVTVADSQIISEEVFLIQPPTRQFLFTDIHGLTWNQRGESKGSE